MNSENRPENAPIERTEPNGEEQSPPPKSTWQTVKKWFRRVNVAYAIVLLVVLALLEFRGETGLLLSVPLFLPAWGWCIPSLVAIPLCAIIDWRTIGIHLLLIPMVLWWYMGYESNGPKENATPDLTIMAYNYGQRRGTEFSRFAERIQPDIIVLVDAPNRTPKYKAQFPDMHFAEVGEFLIMSKYEVLGARKAVVDPENDAVIAARFDVDHPKRRIAVYAVHLPTPRRQFESMRSGRLGGVLPGRQLLSSDGRESYRQYLENKFALARDLLFELEHDPLPCLVVGDMNTPPRGVIYRKLREQLSDCFDERGRGYGHTFPGDDKKLYALRQPWLRIDYVFRDDNWETCDFETETGRRTQHLAVAAKLLLKSE